MNRKPFALVFGLAVALLSSAGWAGCPSYCEGPEWAYEPECCGCRLAQNIEGCLGQDPACFELAQAGAENCMELAGWGEFTKLLQQPSPRVGGPASTKFKFVYDGAHGSAAVLTVLNGCEGNCPKSTKARVRLNGAVIADWSEINSSATWVEKSVTLVTGENVLDYDNDTLVTAPVTIVIGSAIAP